MFFSLRIITLKKASSLIYMKGLGKVNLYYFVIVFSAFCLNRIVLVEDADRKHGERERESYY